MTNVAQLFRYIDHLRIAEAMEVDLLVQIMDLPPRNRIACLPILARLHAEVEALRLATTRALAAQIVQVGPE